MESHKDRDENEREEQPEAYEEILDTVRVSGIPPEECIVE
jgi:hypothetical protein